MSLRKLHNAFLGKSFTILPHAMERWIERGRGDLASEFEQAVPFGAQYGNDVLLLSPGGAVFACKRDNPAVLTVLTKEQATANTERYNLGLHRLYGSAGVPASAAEVVEQNRRIAEKHRKADLQRIAQEHFEQGRTAGKRANKYLREAGYDPGSGDGVFYREVLNQLWQAHYAKIRESNRLADKRRLENQGA